MEGQELNKFPLAYRSTPHSTTGKSPAELLFRRVLNNKMPELSGLDDEEADISDQGARDRDTQKKQANKDYESDTYERETWFCWSRRDKTSYRHHMRRSHMR